jgi:hypothetical protein
MPSKTFTLLSYFMGYRYSENVCGLCEEPGSIYQSESFDVSYVTF